MTIPSYDKRLYTTDYAVSNSGLTEVLPSYTKAIQNYGINVSGKITELESELSRITCQLEETESELSCYRKGTEFVATCQVQNFEADCTTGMRFDMFEITIPNYVGKRVRVLIMGVEV